MRLELSLQLVRVATIGSLEAGRNVSSVRARTPQRRATEPPPAKNATPRGNATGAKRAKATMSRVHNATGTPSTRNIGWKKGNLHKSYEAATAADGANNSRSCLTTELRVGASSSFNLRSQAWSILRFCSSLR